MEQLFESPPTQHLLRTRIMGVVCIIFFGIGVVLGAIQIIVPWCSYLELDDKGFPICSMFRKHFYRWDEISDFGVANIRQNGIAVNKMVTFNFSEKFDRLKVVRKVSKSMCGAEGGLQDTFGLKAEELAKLMTEFKSRYESGSQS
jgi:hypothetical protein